MKDDLEIKQKVVMLTNLHGLWPELFDLVNGNNRCDWRSILNIIEDKISHK